MRTVQSLLFALFFLFLRTPVSAIEAEEVVILANARVNGSVTLAKYYMERRGIPDGNLIVLRAPATEEISRRDYVRTIRNPVRSRLEKMQKVRRDSGRLPVSTLVSLFGMPLKIAQQGPRPEGRSLTLAERNMAAVDSELALVMTPHNPGGWVQNPYYQGHRQKRLTRADVLLVSRLDGPEEALVRRLIDTTLETEKNGLKGRAFFDARGIASVDSPPKGDSGYAWYDFDLLRAAKLTKRCLPTTVDTRPQLFAQGGCPQAAIYCGWYSCCRYVDSFSWVPGAIGWHMASGEAQTLVDADSTAWVPQMLQRGVVGAIGPVYEPYIQAFPPPSLLLHCLLERQMSLGEAWLVSSPVVSWQMILVGDPLYQPFKNLKCAESK